MRRIVPQRDVFAPRSTKWFEKIKLAKEMLLQTNRSATEISYACGYETISYFFRVFKQAVGMTPVQYRARAALEIAKS